MDCFKLQKERKEDLDNFICEMQSDLAKTYTQMILSAQAKSFNPFI
jgi:hypothetical protein